MITIFNFQISIFNWLGNHSPVLYLTQSLWRDEAFSVLMSEPPVSEIIRLTAHDFNPPLYYIILHFWMKIFGNGEVAIRMLSFLFHLGLVYIVYQFAQKLKFPRLLTVYCLLFTFLNPMLIYFAFEARMYSLLALLATASMYFFFSKNWLLYILCSALGLWTQPFMAFVILSQVVYLVLTRRLTKDHILYLISISLLFSPWLPTIFFQFSRSGPMWIWPINWTTVTTILGNLFTGYEGTPGGLWNQMAIISLIILFLSFLLFRHAEFSSASSSGKIENFLKLLLLWLFLPVTLVLLISYFKPIYVNRYFIFITVAEIFVTVIGISLLKNKFVRVILYTLYFILIAYFNIWFPPLHQKQDIRTTITEIKTLAKPSDLLYSQTPLTFFEANYYFKDRSRVFLYNPNKVAVPLYAGAGLIPETRMIYNLPEYPTKAFLIHDDASYEVVSQR